MSTWDDCYDALKSIMEADGRTSDLRQYAGEDPAKPKLPCMVVFPRTKQVEKAEGSGRRRRLPRKTWYTYDIVVCVDGHKREKLLFGTDSITDFATRVEDVLKDNENLDNSCADTDWGDIGFEFRPGFMAIAVFQLRCRVTETE